MAVGRDGQNLIRAERGRQRKDATRPATNAARIHRTLIGYLLTCLRTGAWRGSVQVPGPSLSFRLPALVVWLSFGLRGSSVAVWAGEAQVGFVLLEVAVPFRLEDRLSERVSEGVG